MVVFGVFVFIVVMLIVNFGNMELCDEIYVQVYKFFFVVIVFMVILCNDVLDQFFKIVVVFFIVIGNFFVIWFVLFFVFVIVFIQVFSLMCFGEEEDNNINFRIVLKVFILLFCMSFGEGWNGVMEDFVFIEFFLCVVEVEFFDSDCGSKLWVWFLFVVWNIISMYIFVSLFVFFIYESFSYVY